MVASLDSFTRCRKDQQGIVEVQLQGTTQQPLCSRSAIVKWLTYHVLDSVMVEIAKMKLLVTFLLEFYLISTIL